MLTGASGAGKTTLARCVERQGLTNCQVLYFDSIGVPSVERMRAAFGDEGGWQRLMTLRWIERIKPILDAGVSVFFEGQMRIAFVNEGLRSTGSKTRRSSLSIAKTKNVKQGVGTAGPSQS